MKAELLDRLESAVERLLERNRQLTDRVKMLEQERQEWHAERRELLDDVEKIIDRLDGIDLEAL